MNKIHLYKSPWIAIKLLLMTIPFVAGGIWMINRSDSTNGEIIMGWVCSLFFGLGLPIGFYHLFDRRPAIIISVDGVWDRTLKTDVIRWEFIDKAYPMNINGQKFICLDTNKEIVLPKKFKWAAKLNSFVGAQRVNLNLGQIKHDSELATEFILRLAHATVQERRKRRVNQQIPSESNRRIVHFKTVDPISLANTFLTAN